MKLSVWARQNGLSRQTAYRWFHAGILPVPAQQLPTGTILVTEIQEVAVEGSVALYARVSSRDQKPDLDRQLGRLTTWATDRGLHVTHAVREVGSGLNGRRSKLVRLLKDPEVQTIVVEHRDRLARFGVEYLEAALAATRRKLVVVEEGEAEDDLVQDMVDVLTSFCARLYGRRSARNRAKRALAAARGESG